MEVVHTQGLKGGVPSLLVQEDAAVNKALGRASSGVPAP